MTDNEIIKALECCEQTILPYCSSCSYNKMSGCSKKLKQDALDLINRQRAEIERYEKENHEKFNKWMLLDKRTKERYAELYEVAKGVVRAEAVKEFAERLKEEMADKKYKYVTETNYSKTVNAVVDACIITTDNLVKEMVGEQE